MKVNNKNKQKRYQNYANMLKNKILDDNNSQQQYDITSPSLSQNYVNDFKPKEVQRNRIFQANLDYDLKKILHLWLVGIFPGYKFQTISYDFVNKKIKGRQQQCIRKLKQCQQFIKTHIAKILSEKQLSFNQIKLYEKGAHIKIFNRQKIQRAFNQLVDKYSLIDLKGVVGPLLEKKFIYFISVLKVEEPQFNKLLQLARQKQITRSMIEKAHNQRQERYIGRNFHNQTKGVQDSDVSIKFSQISITEHRKSQSSDSLQDESQNQQQQSNNNIQDKTSSQSDEEQIQQQKDYKHEKQCKKQDKNLIFQKELPNSFNLNKFRTWIMKNKNLNIREFKFIEGQLGLNINIKLYSTTNIQKKQNAMKYFFQHYKIVDLTQFDPQCRRLLQQKLDQFQQFLVEYKLCSGYVEPQNRKQQALKKLYLSKRIKKKQTKKQKQFVYFIFLNGVKPDVDEMSNQIFKLMQQIQQELKSLKRTVVKKYLLDLKKIEDYLQDKRIIGLVQQVLVEIFQKYQYIKLLGLYCPSSKFTIQLQIYVQKLKQFEAKQFNLIQKWILQRIQCKQIGNDLEIDDDLLKKYILLKSKANQDKIVIIQDRQKLAEAMMQIVQKSKSDQMQQKQICFKKKWIQILKDKIQKLIRADGNNIWKYAKLSYKAGQNEAKVQVFGPKKYLKKIIQQINLQLDKINDEAMQKGFIISNLETQLITKHKNQLKSQINKFPGISYSLNKNAKVDLQISLANCIEIYIFMQKRLHSFAKNSNFVFLQSDDLTYLEGDKFQTIKQYFNLRKYTNKLQKTQDHQYKYFYFNKPNKLKETIGSIIQIPKNKSDEQLQTYIFFMPKNNKAQFIEQLLHSFYQNKKDQMVRIFVYQKHKQDIKQNFQSLIYKSQLIKKKVCSRYVIKDTVHDQQHSYSQIGYQKIQKAFKQGSKKVFLSNSDLNLAVPTHICSFKDQKLIHIQSKKVIPLQIYPSKVQFQLNGIIFQMPAEQIAKVQKQQKKQDYTPVSIGVYEIDFDKNIQTNLFSGFRRSIIKKQFNVQNPFGNFNLDFNFDCVVNQIQINYDKNEQNKCDEAITRIKQLIQKNKITKMLKNDGITIDRIRQIKEICQNSNIQLKIINSKQIKLIGCEKQNLQVLYKFILSLLQKNQKKIKFPDFWEDQKQQIQTFIVKKQTDEFKQVEKKFEIGQIVQIIRIQNIFCYEKYADQKQFLIKLNQGKAVKQMMLFHGTSSADPKLIYNDKQESFNINYTKQSNYLGMAIYFAENSKYSDSYAYNFIQNGQVTKSMFYCNVLVGDSQQFEKQTETTKAMRDSNFKESQRNIRYQSSTLKTNRSRIYAVYKSRRAYPQYLIKYKI